MRSWQRWVDLVIIGVAAAVALAIVRQREPRLNRVAVSDWDRIRADGLLLGDSAAAMSIVEFVDYRCPACRSAEGVVAAIERDFPAQVSRVVRLVPVRRGDAVSDTAALSAVCAAEQGGFEGMHRVLFAHGDLVGAARWDSLARLAQITDTERFFGCLRSPRAQMRIEADRAEGEALGVSMLPTFIIDRTWMGAIEPRQLRQVLMERLR